jgi:hypothetical protein
VLRALGERSLAPALAWVRARRAALARASGEAAAADLEWTLVTVQFLDAARGPGGGAAALALARAAFPAAAAARLADVQALMGALAFVAAGRALPSRYAALDGDAPWRALEAAVRAAAAALAGQPPRPPLLTALGAGAAALPTLLKLAAKAGGGDRAAAAAAAAAGDELPVDADLGPEFAFSSVFSCPVSKDTATAANPPVLLPCGHVLCRESASSLARAPGRAFKCPYCPADATLAAARVLRFPPPGVVGSGGGGGGG